MKILDQRRSPPIIRPWNVFRLRTQRERVQGRWRPPPWSCSQKFQIQLLATFCSIRYMRIEDRLFMLEAIQEKLVMVASP